MAPLKLENKIKETIEERTIQPSAQAWDKLGQKLGKESKPWYMGKSWHLGIAASIIGVLLITFYTNKSKDEVIIPAETIVTNPAQTTIESQGKIVTPQDEIIVSIDEPVKTNKVSTPNTNRNKIKKNIPAPIKNESINEAIANNTIEEKTIETPIETSFEELKIEEVVAQIQNLQETNSYVSDAEIDSLLNSAQQEIANQKIFDEHTNTVNAIALLEAVELDLDRTFRDKVFEALKESYKNVRTAYTNRNN